MNALSGAASAVQQRVVLAVLNHCCLDVAIERLLAVIVHDGEGGEVQIQVKS